MLLFAHGAAWGQARDSAKMGSHWFVGGGAAVHSYININVPYSRTGPPYLMGGYIVDHRLAIQAEVHYGRRNEENNGGDYMVDGELYNFRSKAQTTSTALLLLARFTRSRPQRHLQFDWLLGMAIVHGRLNETNTRTSATRSDSYVYPTISSTAPHLVGGISLRYLVSPRFTIGTELLLSKSIPFNYWTIIPGGGASLGVSYLLTPRKP